MAGDSSLWEAMTEYCRNFEINLAAMEMPIHWRSQECGISVESSYMHEMQPDQERGHVQGVQGDSLQAYLGSEYITTCPRCWTWSTGFNVCLLGFSLVLVRSRLSMSPFLPPF